MLDDTLSAMDAHVGKIVFDQCIRGLFREKAVVFATNQLGFCSECDYIYVLHDGQLVQKGTYKQLSEQPGQFAELMSHVEGVKVQSEALDEAGDESAEVSPSSTGCPSNPQTPGSTTTPGSTVSTKPDDKRELYKAEDAEHKSEMLSAFLAICRAADSFQLGILMLILTLLAPLAQYFTNIMLARWTDAGGHNSDYDLVFSYIGVAVVFGALQFLRGWVFAKFFVRASRTLFNKMLRAVLRQKMVWYDTTPIGRILNRFSGDMTTVEVFLPFLIMMPHYCRIAVVAV